MVYDMIFTMVTFVHPGGLLSSKAKRAKCSTHKQRVIVMLYNKVCDIVSNISELLEIQLLTDTTILQVKLQVLKNNVWLAVITVSSMSSLQTKWMIRDIYFLFPGFFYGNYAVLCGECQWAAALCNQTSHSCKFLFVSLILLFTTKPKLQTGRLISPFSL